MQDAAREPRVDPTAEKGPRRSTTKEEDWTGASGSEPPASLLRENSSSALSSETNSSLIRRILSPTDFTADSLRALEHAVTLARQSRATVTILHVVDINPQCLGPAEGVMQTQLRAGSAGLERLAGGLAGQVEVQTVLQEGLPWEEIVEQSRDFDLVVMGRGSHLKRWNPFSQHTAERVAEQAACPVIMLPPASAGSPDNKPHSPGSWVRRIPLFRKAGSCPEAG